MSGARGAGGSLWGAANSGACTPLLSPLGITGSILGRGPIPHPSPREKSRIEHQPPRASCRVFTFKEGMLSALAHDLELEVTRFTLTVAEDRSRVEAWFDTGSLRVLGPAVLSASDREQIARNIREDVLHSARWPTARFASTRVAGTEDAWEVEGAFELHGKSRPLRA